MMAFGRASTAMVPTSTRRASGAASVLPAQQLGSRSSSARSSWPLQRRERRLLAPGPSAASTTTSPVGQQQSATLSSTWVTKEARKAMFSPAQEQFEPVAARVVGTIPTWLNGDLVTNGAGSYKGMVHMFDGLAMLSKVSIRGGKVTGMQRHIRTKQRKHQEETGKLKWREFVAEVPTSGPLEKAGAVAENLLMLATGSDATTDNASVNILPLPDGTLLAMSEPATSVYRISREELNTLEQVRYKDDVPGQVLTAHAKEVPSGGPSKRVVNFAHKIPFGGKHLFLQDLDTLKRKEIAYFPDANPASPAWVHDLAATRNYAVIVEPPILFNMGCLVAGGERDYLFMDWVPQQKTRVHVAKLDGSWQRTFVTDAFFLFHHVNAYEDPDNPNQLHVDLSAYDGPQVLNDLSLASMVAYPGENISPSYLKRLTIPLDAPDGAHIPPPKQVLQGDPQQYGEFYEFPTINQQYRTRPYRYTYSLSARRPTNMGNAIAKHDLVTGQSLLWHEPGCAPGEPAFVPSPNAQSEDDGVVVCNVMGADGKSFVVVLDASTWQELGRAYLPFPMGYRLHGMFLPSKSS